MNLNELGKEASAITASKGFEQSKPEDFDNPEKMLAALCLIHGELSEAQEEVRVGNFEHFGEELADVAIRLVGFAFNLGIDLDAEVAKKMEKNRKRPHKHGGKRI